jgi:uncharacterized RDD family membrane protein YckC
MNKNKININILRMLAYLIDTVVFILFIIPLILVIASFTPSNLRDYTYVQYSLFSVIFSGYVVYYLVSWKSRYQRTLGQLFAGLKLLSTKESELTYSQCILKILILSLPLVLFMALLSLKANSVTKIGGNYLLCIPYALLPIYLVIIWKIDSLIGVYTVKHDEIQKSSYLIRFKRIAAHIIDLLISLQFCAQLFFISFMLWGVLRVTIFKNANISCSGECAFVMSFNAFVIAYYLYHFISWKDGYRRTLGQLFLKLKAVNLNTEKHPLSNRSIKIFFLLLPILPLVIFFNYALFFYDFGEGAVYLISILIAWGVITQIICLGFSDEIDYLAGMKIANSNKKEVL